MSEPSTQHGLALTGWALHLPGVALGRALGIGAGSWADAVAVPADDAKAVLGRKGLLAKDPATRLALCAVHRALGWAPGARRDPAAPIETGTAVVACGTLVNVATVAQVARTVAAEGGGAVSVLDAPNVSSNIVASTVALWFGFGGPNLAVASGPDAGWDGLALAALLLRAYRADRVVLVGTEPADEVARALHSADGSNAPLCEGAAAVVLELPGSPSNRAPQQSRTGRALLDLQASVGFVAKDGALAASAGIQVGPGGVDPVAAWGDTYGADAVVALALAAHLAVDDGHATVAVSHAGAAPDGVQQGDTPATQSEECHPAAIGERAAATGEGTGATVDCAAALVRAGERL